MTAIIPIKPEFVHVGNDPPCREDRLRTDHATPGKGEVVETLAHRGTRIAFSLLVCVERAADILELGQHLRNLTDRCVIEIAHGKIGFARAAPGPCSGNRKLRIERETAVGPVMTGLHIAPCVPEESVDQCGFG